MTSPFSLGPERQRRLLKPSEEFVIHCREKKQTERNPDGDWRKAFPRRLLPTGPTRNLTEVTPTNQVSAFRMGFHQPTNSISDKAASAGPFLSVLYSPHCPNVLTIISILSKLEDSYSELISYSIKLSCLTTHKVKHVLCLKF